MNILIIKLSAIGDVVHTLPSLAALRKLYPHAHITWVIEEAASDLIRDNPLLDKVIVSRRKTWIADIKKCRLGVLREIFEFIREVRSRNYDLVIDFHGLLKSALIVFISSGKRKLGYDSMQELSGLFLTEKIPEDMKKHAVFRYLDFIRYLCRQDSSFNGGGDEENNKKKHMNASLDEDPVFVLPTREEEEKKIERLLQKRGVVAKRFVAVNPIALWETKLWDDGSIAELSDLVSRELALSVVFTGMEKEKIRRIQAMMKSASVSLAGETSLRELACLYRHATLVISTDSGPMHIAAAVGTPVVGLFGPTDPARTGPYGSRHRVLRTGLSCSPCFLKKCDSRECMRRITAKEAFQAILDLLGKQPS